MELAVAQEQMVQKSWLRENLLCLLSNAAKYSSSADISVVVEVIDRGMYLTKI